MISPVQPGGTWREGQSRDGHARGRAREPSGHGVPHFPPMMAITLHTRASVASERATPAAPGYPARLLKAFKVEPT